MTEGLSSDVSRLRCREIMTRNVRTASPDMTLSAVASMMREGGVHRRLDITETASTVATTVLLEASDMAAIMPASLAAHYARLGVLQVLPLQLPLQVPSLHLITRRHRELSPAAASFVEVLRAERVSVPVWESPPG